MFGSLVVILAHHLGYREFRGPIPRGMMAGVLASCGLQAVAFLVTGGLLGLSGNYVNVNGAGRFLENTTADPVLPYGDTFTVNGEALPLIPVTAVQGKAQEGRKMNVRRLLAYEGGFQGSIGDPEAVSGPAARGFLTVEQVTRRAVLCLAEFRTGSE